MEVRDVPPGTIHGEMIQALHRQKYEQSAQARIDELLAENERLRDIIAAQLKAHEKVDAFCAEWLGLS